MKLIFKVLEYSSAEYLQALDLRIQVLFIPANIDHSEEGLSHEKEFAHIAGILDGTVVATTMLVAQPKALKMARVAVATNMQGKGLGSMMLEFSEEYARIKKWRKIYCHAQDVAVNFYAKHGYKEEGEYFNECGIQHIKMKKAL